MTISSMYAGDSQPVQVTVTDSVTGAAAEAEANATIGLE